MSRFGYNYLAVPDVNTEMQHAHKANLGGGLFFQDQVDFARRFKRERPSSYTVLRNWPDGAVPKSTDDWLRANLPFTEGDLIVQTNNEVGLTDANIAFHTDLLRRIKRDKIKGKFGIFATSVGTPDPDKDWPRCEELLKLADDLYDQIFMIHHEYAGGVITSGFNGGDPTMIQPNTWPQDTSGITLWHIGRYRFLKRYQKSKGRRMLRTIIGENGFDFTGDIHNWLASLHSTAGQYDIVDGWRDLLDTWQGWWHSLGWTAPKAYMEQLKYEDQHIYTDPEIVAILLFARWNNGSWKNYQTNPELDAYMEAYALEGGYIPPSVPPTQPPTTPVDHPSTKDGKLTFNVEVTVPLDNPVSVSAKISNPKVEVTK